MRRHVGTLAAAALPLLAAPVRSATYNQTLAIWYASLAGAAYCDEALLASWTCGPKCVPGMADGVDVCQGLTTNGFVGQSADGKCVVSFEGTSSTGAARTDLDFLTKAELHGFWVHEGFLREWGSLKPCVRSALRSRDCGWENSPVGITGHSLGGALAVLAAFDFALAALAAFDFDLADVSPSDMFSVSEVYTFGMPRVGDANFADEFDRLYRGRFFRVVHGSDPFVDMPPRWVPLFGSYRHLGPEVFYPGHLDQGCVICSSRDDCPTASYGSRSWHHRYLGVDMAQVGCASPVELSCTDDIPDSWCSHTVGCRCDAGYCPVLGRCCEHGVCPPEPPAQAAAQCLGAEPDEGAEAPAALQAGAAEEPEDSGAPAADPAGWPLPAGGGGEALLCALAFATMACCAGSMPGALARARSRRRSAAADLELRLVHA